MQFAPMAAAGLLGPDLVFGQNADLTSGRDCTHDTFCNSRTYITSHKRHWQHAMSYCASQHSTGLVIWDTEDKYLDVKYIVGKLGHDGYTALYNPSNYICASASKCSGQLVRLRIK